MAGELGSETRPKPRTGRLVRIAAPVVAGAAAIGAAVGLGLKDKFSGGEPNPDTGGGVAVTQEIDETPASLATETVVKEVKAGLEIDKAASSDILTKLNAERAKLNLPALLGEPKLSASAEAAMLSLFEDGTIKRLQDKQITADEFNELVITKVKAEAVKRVDNRELEIGLGWRQFSERTTADDVVDNINISPEAMRDFVPPGVSGIAFVLAFPQLRDEKPGLVGRTQDSFVITVYAKPPVGQPAVGK